MGKTADQVYVCEPWRITQTDWKSEQNPVDESVFSLANEYMGIRGYAEEGADAPGLTGTYFGGVYEWDSPAPAGYRGIIRQAHHMVCAADFMYTRLYIHGTRLLLSDVTTDFERILDMRTGMLHRGYTLPLPGGGSIRIELDRLLCMDIPEYAAQRIRLTASENTETELTLAVDGGVEHKSSGQCQWCFLDAQYADSDCGVRYRTQTTDQTLEYLFRVRSDAAMHSFHEGHITGMDMTLHLQPGIPVTVERLICNTVQPAHEMDLRRLDAVPSFDDMLAMNRIHWTRFWSGSDVQIDHDPLNQQGIRYCLFQLHQTYRGLDGRHNIGAKGLTGEAYSGHAFWDTETYCLPYYLFNDRNAARSLLMFRYHSLDKARARARELDCNGACYPIATLNGVESCGLWQHASLQMQPSTAVAYAILEYAELTGDDTFLFNEGIEMLTEICRYIVSRGDWNADHTGFGFWGVMGPDEFHMMVNNDFYTNYMGMKTLKGTLEVLGRMEHPEAWATQEECRQWQEISEHMIFHVSETGVFEQHDGYFTLPHLDIHSIPVSEFPLYAHWSYDRIYRTDMIKQPSVLMVMFLYPGDFTDAQVAANYDFYEPRCIHESSLSPSVHSILAQRLGRSQAASGFFRFATRLDLDNYNRNTAEGLHLTSITAAWVTIVYGFGGLHTEGSTVCLDPHLPEGWTRYSFSFLAGDGTVRAEVDASGCRLCMLAGTHACVRVSGILTEVHA